MATDAQATYRERLVEAVGTIERLRKRLEELEARPAAEPIAIIGTGCRMPGGGDDPEALWRLLKDGVDATGEFPVQRADPAPFFDPDPETPGKAYVVRGAFLQGPVDQFEPAVFGISPREANGMDPQQRLTLEVAWEALERAGYAPDRLEGSATGVFLGLSTTDYVRLRQQLGAVEDIDGYQLIGEPAFLAGRISYTFGLRGPSKVIDTTCSSSLVALHSACRSLRSGECDMALAGGVNLMLTPYGFVMLSKFRALATDGRCKTFDARADGYARGEGAGIVVLKRLTDALSDGDHVVAVVRGSAINHDGRSSGISVPSPEAQQAVIRAALADAGVEGGDIGYLEAHGTGTALGDPIELRAVEAVLGRDRPPHHPLLVGSIKTNIGHLEAAAGIAGLLKVVLAIEHGEIPRHLHFQVPNPNIEWDRLHIEVTTSGATWPANGRPRLAGVSSFGASGTNAHAVIAEPPARPRGPRTQRSWNVLTLSARSESALRELADRYAGHLRGHPDLALGDVCFTTHVGRSRLHHGLAVTGASLLELASQLTAFAAGERRSAVWTCDLAPYKQRKVAWLFTGQGSQYARMGEGLGAEPAYRTALERCEALMDPLLDRPLASLLDPPPGSQDLLDQTGATQPALFAVEYALAQLWLSWGLRPAAVMGHSVGEIVAACVAGVLSLDDAVRLVVARGQLMQRLPAGGVMASLACNEQSARAAIAAYPRTVAIAAVNSPTDTVIAGLAEHVEAVTAELERAGVTSRRLRVSHAFHSPLMRPMLEDLAAVARTIRHRPPQRRLISNVTGELWSPEEAGSDYWVRHAAAPVRFSDGIRALHADGFRTFLEVGPAPVLLGLGARSVDDPDCVWIPSLRGGQDDRQRILLALGGLYARGLNVDWRAFHQDEDVRRVPLPTYTWRRDTHWFRLPDQRPKEAPAVPAVPAVLAETPLLGRRLRAAVPTYEPVLDAERWSGLARSTADGEQLGLGGVLELALAAAEESFDGGWDLVEDLVIMESLPLDEPERTVQVTLSPGKDGRATFRLSSLSAVEEGAGAPWRVHARAMVSRRPAARDPEEAPAPLDVGFGQVVDLEDGPLTKAIAWLRRGSQSALLALGEELSEGAGEHSHRMTVLEAAGVALVCAAGLEGDRWPPAPLELGALHDAQPLDVVRYLRARVTSVGADEVSGDVDFLCQQGWRIGGMRRLRLAPANRVVPPAAPWRRPEELLYTVEWRKAEQAVPDSVDLAGQRFLLVADRGGIAEQLAERLASRGAQCVLAAPLSDGEHSSSVALGFRPTPEGVSQLVGRLVRDGTAPTHAVVLTGLNACRGEETTVESLIQLRTCTEDLVVSLVQALSRQQGIAPVRLWLVTRGAQPADPDQDGLTVAAGPLWGLGRVVALECPDLWGGLVDLDPGEPDGEVDGLIAALAAEDGEDQQALRGDRRMVARLVPHRDATRVAHERPIIRRPGSYLITGGLGGIGLTAARWLATKGAESLVLVGRTGLPERAHWDEADLEPSVRDKIDKVRALEALGARVEVVSADTTDRGAMAALITRLQQGTAGLRGVLHAAGVSGPQLLPEVTLDEYHAVLRPKVEGGWILHELTKDLELDFFVCYSSIASVWGSQHLASYSAANAFLDSLAHYRQALGLPALTVNWGPWELASGLFGGDVMAFLESVGLGQLSAPQCLQLLGGLIAAGDPQQVVCAVDWSIYKPVMEARAERPLLRTIDDRDEPDGDKAPSQVLAGLRAAAADGSAGTLAARRLAVLTEYMRTCLVSALGVGPNEIEPDADVMALGLDSLMVMEIVRRCKQDLQVTIRPNQLFQRPTLGEWSAHLAAEVEQAHGLSEAAELSEAPADPPDGLADHEGPATAAVPERPQSAGDPGAAVSLAWLHQDVTLDPVIQPASPLVERWADPSSVLLTGATGFVGAYLLDELLAETQARILCLVRCASEDEGLRRLRANVERYLPWREASQDRIVPIPGDLAKPLLGLSEARFDTLAREVQAIYHNGAWVNFAYPYAQLRATNLSGTEEILRLACRGPLTPVNHVSTYGIWGLPADDHLVIWEDDDIDGAGRLINGYVQSKWAAERLVLLARARGVPVDVYRLGRVLGDSRTGACLTTHFTCRVIKGCVQLGLAPDIDVEVEMTPADYVSRALVRISKSTRVFGSDYHLINTRHMPFHDLVRFMQRRGWAMRLVSAEQWWAALYEGLGERGNELHPVMDAVEELVMHSEKDVDYDVTNATEALRGSGITCPPLDDDLLHTYFDYFVRCGYLDPPRG